MEDSSNDAASKEIGIREDWQRESNRNSETGSKMTLLVENGKTALGLVVLVV